MEAHIKRPVPARSSSHRSFRTTQSPRESAAAAPPPSSPHHASPLALDQQQLSPRSRPSRPPLALSSPADCASRHRDRHLQHQQHTPPAQRAPSTDSSPLVSGTPSSVRARRLSSSSSATRPTPSSVSSSGSYFGPHAPSSADARSPASRKPPASHSSHGIETSYGPPIALITRRRSNTSDVARRSQSPADAALIQPQFSPFSSTGPAPAAASHRHTRTTSDTTVKAHGEDGRRSSRSRSLPSSRATSPNPPPPARRSFSTSPGSAMANNSFSDSQSDYDFAYSHRSRPDDRSGDYARDAKASSSEDLFLNIAQDSPRNQDGDDDTVKIERRRSRIARMNRQSLPANSLNSPATRPTIDTAIKTPTAIQTRQLSHIRPREPHTAVTASFPVDGSRVRSFGMSSSGSFGFSRSRDQDDSPQNRRSSIPDPSRAAAATRDAAARESRYRSTNLTYASRYNQPTNQPTTPLENSPEILSKPEQQSRTSDTHDGSESLDSTTATSTVWDELDELKSRIKKLELTGKMPPTSGAAVTSFTASERPRTATTQATSVTASPKQQKKSSVSPPETTVSGAGGGASGAAGASHPLLHSALAKCKDAMSPSFYRILEVTATDALELAAITSGGNMSSAVSNSGAPTSERQLRRKADNMCRSLTELCIALCDNSNGKNTDLRSPGLAPPSRRQSVQMNGERERDRDREREREQFPPRGGSAEPEGDMRNSPSRALNRIEARRTSMLVSGSAGNSPRDGPDRDRTTPTQGSRYQSSSRAGTSLLNGRPRRATVNNDDQPEMEEETQTLRVPSRAMTDFTQNQRSHGNRSNRLSREYTSNVPLPDGATVVLQHATSIRRPNGAVPTNDSPTSHHPASSSSSFLRDRRLERTSASESPRASDFGGEDRRQRLSFYSNSTPRSATSVAPSGIARTASLSRRLRQET
ncbi:lpxtg-motif cell wall anchor domain [Botryosphaeria dothidea]|uniref:Lpxtg-motif cell wall anchor domain n=1 Tax=Botryosphaeria dothidea TaxID=55169 RepID=A0A8H4IX00_9PEZI|nr:lpxtg-motif cell wall anchor domain [Botryosphaeria dothidea]